MALYNSNQVLKGARNRGGLKTYNQCSVIDKPVAAIAGTTITFTGGLLEAEGKNYTLSTFDFAPVAALLKAATTYTLSAVPDYLTPADQTAAIAAGVNYVVSQTVLGESVLNYFLPPAVVAQATALGGYEAISKRVQIGTASEADFRSFASFSSERDKLADPRYTGQTLPINGIRYVLTEVTPQNNSSKSNALSTFTANDFAEFRATQGDIPAELKVFTSAQAVTAYETPNKTFLCKRIFGYTSLNNANASIGGVEIGVYNNVTGQLLLTPFSAPTDIITGVAVASQTHFVVYEFFYPSYIEPGNEGTKDKVLNILSNRDSSLFGRINPIYLDNPFDIQRSSMMQAMARPALTLYNNPCDLVKVTVTSLGPVVLNALAPVYDMLIE
jgi:hypothetical protein